MPGGKRGGQHDSGMTHGSNHHHSAPKKDEYEEEEEELTADEKLQQELDSAIDNLTESRSATRVKALKTLADLLATHYLPEFLSTRGETILDSVLKRCFGSIEERLISARIIALVFVQEGGEREYLLAPLVQKLQTIVGDQTGDTESRVACAAALGLVLFLLGDEMESVVPALDLFSEVVGQLESHYLTAQAVRSWTLLLTGVSVSTVRRQARLMDILCEDLGSHNVELIEAVGEAIVVLRELDDELVIDPDALDVISDLASEHTKRKAKSDLKEQRAAFRAIAQSLEGEGFEAEKMTIFKEKIVIESWREHHQMEALRSLLAGGLDVHIHENPIVRDVFGLGDTPEAGRRLKPSDKSALKQELADQKKNRSLFRSHSREHKTQRATSHEDDEE